MNLNTMIDHTLLRPDATEDEIRTLCDEARRYAFASVCVNPCYVPLARTCLENSGVKVCTVIGFPLGANASAVKAAETRLAYEQGCDEFDMVLAVGKLRSRRCDEVLEDIRAVVNEAKGKTVKVILETCLLSRDEIVLACRLAVEAGASFVKTSTGFSKGGATVEDVRLMKQSVPASVRVKASAGIRTKEQALAMVEAGADRIGTSAGVKIMEDNT